MTAQDMAIATKLFVKLQFTGEDHEMSANIEERFEGMARRLERAEQANRAMKIWSSIAFTALMAFGAGPFASNVTAKSKPPAIVTATQEIDLDSGGKTVASLRMVAGKPNLVFFDSAGKTVVDVGIDGATLPTGHAAGIAVLDGNEDIPGTGKIRATLGVTPSGPAAGVGNSTYDGNGTQRSADGSAIDGSLAYDVLYDATAVARTGMEYDPGINFNGSFSDDASGNNRSSFGSGVDGSYSGAFIYDAAGKLRDQTIYIPSANFNGTQSYDGAGHPLSSEGNFLVNNAAQSIEANQSFVDLSDTAGTLRVFEFQNSTNEGGVDFDPGSTTVQGFWGNP
jgi:hypothetical protein